MPYIVATLYLVGLLAVVLASVLIPGAIIVAILEFLS